ncbi:bifunctional diguanylate cyclase/phosphodiesterase [Kineococcus terrestris]|uniref:bifunctional diguanylate cyclase/phosphodiesterase n=1 Tax=Kineococcus terrestris TaxID=2044856 RepID=UPI0034DB50C7
MDFTSAAGATLRFLHSVLGMDLWIVSRRDGEDYVVLSALDTAEVGVDAGDVMAWTDTYCAAAVEGAAPRFAEDVSAVPAWVRARELNGLPFTSYLTVPMRASDGTLLGTVCAGSLRRVRASETALDGVQLSADLLATVLEHEAARSALRAADPAPHEVDPVTRLGDRARFERALREEEERAQRYGTTAGVVLVQLEDLPQVNERAGHEAGDALLRRAAHALQARLGDGVLTRLAGGRFAALVPGAGPDEAASLADRLRVAAAASGSAVSTGWAARRAATGLAHAWRQADAALAADRARTATCPGAAAPRVLDPVGAGGPGAGAPGAEPAWTERVSHLLEMARQQLDLDVVGVCVTDGTSWRVVQAAQAPTVPDLRERAWPVAESVCQRLVDGRTSVVVPDLLDDAGAPPFAITRDLGARAYLGVPVHRRDGRLYGSLWGASLRPLPELRARDASVLHVVARVVAGAVDEAEHAADERREVLQRLDALRAAGGPRPVFQPIVAVADRSVLGAEALSRFPAGTPDAWFGDAARVGAGVPLELDALRAALAAWPGAGLLSVNVSPRTAGSPELVRALAGAPVDRLVLEITEHEPVDDYGALLANLAGLRREGLRLAVDDAGAGFASLRHVLALRPDFLKLDVSLIRDVHLDPTRRALAASLAVFAAESGAAVIAEGVEVAEELECLHGLGVPYAQGYHLGRPAPAEELQVVG